MKIKKLYPFHQITAQADDNPPPQHQTSPSRKMRLAWVFATLLALILVMAVVPAVRARFEDIVKEIGGIPILITEDFPFSDIPRTVPEDIITLEEARDHLGFEFNLPSYMPEGMVLQENEIHASNIMTSIMLTWQDESIRGRVIQLIIDEAIDVGRVVGPDSITEVMINDTPAALSRGGWNGDTKEWEDNGARDLSWQLNGVRYWLSASSEEINGLSNEELIKIAESIPPVEVEEGGRLRPDGE